MQRILYYKILFLLNIFIFITHSFYGQVQMTLLDNETREPVPGAYLICNNQQIATSDRNGILIIPDGISCNLLFISHIGYQSLSINIGDLADENVIPLNPLRNHLDEVMVTATPFHRNIGAIPGSISILHGSSLKSGSQTEIRTHIEQIPGIQMQSGAFNTARLTIRGIGSRTPYASNRINAYYDDIPLTSGDGATIIEDLEINEMGRIEVIKGPSSAYYGPGLGGTIVIRPAPIPYGWNLSALGESGSYDLWRGGAILSHRDSLKHFKAALYQTNFGGYRENSQYERTNFLLSGGTQWNNHTLTLLVNHVDLMAQIPSSVDKTTYRNNPRAAASNWLAIKGYQSYHKWQTGLSLQSVFNQQWSNHLALYGIYNDAFEPRPFNTLDELTQTAGIRQKILFNHPKFSASAGGELFTENYRWRIFETLPDSRGALLTHNRERRYFFNLFAHLEKTFETGTVVTAGANFHRLYYRTRELETDNSPDGERHSYAPMVSPRLGINQKITTGHYLFVSAGHGFSAPSPEEALLPDGSINRDLKPEEGINLEGGVRSLLFSNHAELDVTAYRIWVRNLLMTRRDAEDIFYGENAGKTIHSGLESRFKFHFSTPNHSPEHSITISHTYTVNRFKHFIQDGVDYSNKKLPGLPGSFLNIRLINTLHQNWTIHTSFQHINSQYLNDANTLRYSGHELFDLAVNFDPKSDVLKGLRINGGIQNVFDRHHASMVLVNAPSFGTAPPRYYYPGLPRRFYIRLIYDIFRS